MKTNTMDARIKELMAMGATFAEAHAAALNEAVAFGNKGKKPTGAKAPELVEFVKKDGTKKLVSAKQAAVWEAARNRSNGKTLDEVKAEYEAKHKAFKPSDELIAALKANPVMTRKEAAKLGFVGTKDELKALKLAHKVYAK